MYKEEEQCEALEFVQKHRSAVLKNDSSLNQTDSNSRKNVTVQTKQLMDADVTGVPMPDEWA